MKKGIIVVRTIGIENASERTKQAIEWKFQQVGSIFENIKDTNDHLAFYKEGYSTYDFRLATEEEIAHFKAGHYPTNNINNLVIKNPLIPAF